MRKLLLIVLIVLVGISFTVRLFYLQIIDDSYANLSRNNAVKVKYEIPQRGFIFDRNNKLLVANQPSYDVTVVMKDLKPFDTLEFCSLLNLSKARLKKQFDRAKNYSIRLPYVVVPQLTKSEYAFLQEKMYKYEGFYIQKRSLRDYNTKNAANVLGYISEVNDAILKKNPKFKSGDLIGKQGVEQQYDSILRGIKGVKYFQKDRFNREIGSYKEGKFDTLAVKGSDLQLTIDAELQEYGELLMKNKRGGIVALEPSSGEILALVTAPSYDPDLLVGRKRSPNFTKMHYDTLSKPLFDRGLLAQYPPGSPFKTINALIALQENVIDENDKFSCYHGYSYGRGRKMGCHSHPSPVRLKEGIAFSCNAYFAQIYRKTIEKASTPQLGITTWRNHLQSFGLGNYLGYDLPIGGSGRIPTANYYDRIYPSKRWKGVTTLSNAIGQGEVITTPIQLANMTAAIANRGYFYTPHIVKKINGEFISDPQFTEKKITTIDSSNFTPVIDGMEQVFTRGTAYFLRVPDIAICGKTGTSENFTRIDGKRVQLTDHSIFIAFAPKENPKIALAVFVENGYWGARYAGRISSLMIEKYLKRTVTVKHLEDWILSHSLLEEYKKPYSGAPFKINQ